MAHVRFKRRKLRARGGGQAAHPPVGVRPWIWPKARYVGLQGRTYVPVKMIMRYPWYGYGWPGQQPGIVPVGPSGIINGITLGAPYVYYWR